MPPDQHIEGAVLAPCDETFHQFLIRDPSGIEFFRQVTDEEVLTALLMAEEDQSFSTSSGANWVDAQPARRLSSEIPLVKTARIKLSSPQAAEIGLTNGRVVRIKGEAAREPINAIASAKGSPNYHSTFGVPLEDGRVLVVGVDGSHLDAVFAN